jgi:hypothetical protein
MPKYSTHEPPTIPTLRPTADPRTQRLPEPPTGNTAPTAASEALPAPDLTINKVIAGAGAAATSAILGSFFGAAGTVTGAAFGSVASTVATVVYKRSLDRTRDRLVARVKVTPSRRTDVAEAQVRIPTQRVAPEGETVRMRVEPDIQPKPRRRARPWLWVAGSTALVFAIGLLVVTGVEWAKGSTLTTGETGTSVGRVLTGGAPAAAPTQAPKPTESNQGTQPSSPAEPSTAPTQTPTPSQVPDSGATRNPGPTQQLPGLGNGNGNGQNPPESNSNRGTQSGTQSGAPRSPLVPVPGGAGAQGGAGGAGASGGASSR